MPPYPRPSPAGSSSADQLSVYVIDDHPAIAEAIRDILDDRLDMQFVGTARSAADAIEGIEHTRPDVAVVDISLEDSHGLNLVQQIRSTSPETQVVVFSMYDEVAYAERAIRAGALGYLMKSESTDSVIEAIRAAAKGEVYLSHRMSSRILSKVVRGKGKQPRFAVDDLTDREMSVFQMLGQGLSVQDITDRLGLSRKTIETYRRRAKEKLGVDSVSALLQYAIQWNQGQTSVQSSQEGS